MATYVLMSIGLVVAVWAWSPQKAPPIERISTMRVAYSYWPGTFWMIVASEKGWFEQARLELELISVDDNYYQSLDDLVAGRLDMNNFPLFNLMNAQAKGHDLVMVVNTDKSCGSESIVARPEIQSLADLAGKRVGVHFDHYTEYVLGVVLNQAGLSLSDIEKVDIVDEQAGPVARALQLDALITFEPFASIALETLGWQRLFNTESMPNLSPAGMLFTRSYLERNRAKVGRFVAVWNKTTNFISNNQQRAFRIIADHFGVTWNQVNAFTKKNRLLGLRENVIAFTFGTGMDSLYGAATRMNNFLFDMGRMSRIDITRMFDSEFIDSLDRARFE